MRSIRDTHGTHQRYTPANPCPVCGRGKSCSATADGLHFCMGLGGDPAPAGWIDLRQGATDAAGFRNLRRGEDTRLTRPHPRPKPAGKPAGAKPVTTNWRAPAEQYAAALTSDRKGELATALGLPAGALDAVPLIGWKADEGCWTFPEFDAEGVVIGITRRFPDGTKKLLAGGNRGLTLPAGWDRRLGPIFLAEGASDCLAAHHAGLCCVGRPSATDGRHLSALLTAALGDRTLAGTLPDRHQVVVLGDNDDAGRDGANKVAGELAAALRRPVSVTFPPAGVKDVRAWLTSVDRGDVGWPERGQELAAALLAATRFHPPPGPAPADPATPPVPAYRPFPVHALPPVLREFVVEVAESVDCDPAFAALPALVIAGAAVGAALVACPKRGYQQPPLLWLCAVGDSGTGKSPAMNPAATLAFAINARLKAEFSSAMQEYATALEAWEGGENPDPEKEPSRPVRERFAVIDTTIERLTVEVTTSPRGLVVVRDELDGWFGSFSKYKGAGGGSDVPNWLSMYEAGPVQYMRRTGEPKEVEADRAFVAVCGGIQPDILKRTLSDPAYVASGLAARLGFAIPEKACPRWSDRELSADTERRFADVLNYLRRLPFDPRNGPGRVNLETTALERFKRLNDEFAATAEDISGGPMAAVLPKAVRFSLRLAMVWWCVHEAAENRDPGRGSIPDEAMAAGEELARWFVHEAERVYAVATEGPLQRDERSLAALVGRKGGRVSPRDLQRSNGRKYPSASAAELALDGLVSAGYGRWEDAPAPPGGGWAGKVFVLTDAGTPDTRRPTVASGADAARSGEPPDSRGRHRVEPQERVGGQERLSDVGRRTGHPSLAGDAGKTSDPVSDTSPPSDERRYRPNARRGHRAHDPKRGGA